MKKLLITLVLLNLTFLTGCDDEADSETRAFVARTKMGKPKPIAELEAMTPYRGQIFTGVNLRSPFEIPLALEKTLFEPLVAEKKVYAGPKPDFNRTREPLEGYPLELFTMVGTIIESNTTWGLVKNKSGTLYRVKLGNYIGQNYGQIISLNNTSMKIKELLPDGQGGWRERVNNLTLSN